MNTIGCSGGSLPVSAACFGVVEPDPEDRARARHGGEQGDVGERVLLAVGGGRVAGGEAVADGAAGEGDDAIVAHLAGCSVPSGVRKVARRMAGHRTFVWGLAPLLVPIRAEWAIYGRRSNPGCLGRDDRVVPLVRRRDPLGARPARAAPARRHAVPLAPRPRPQRPPDRRHAGRRGVRAAGQPGDAAARLLLRAHGRGHRPAPRRRPRRATRSTRPSTSSSSSAPSPTSASRSSCPTAPASAAWPRCRARPPASPTPTSSCSPCSPACCRPSSSARARRATCSGCPRRCASTRAGWPRSAASPRRCPGAATRAPRSAARPARSPPPPSRSCSSRPAASSSRPRWSASTSRR